MRKKVKILSSSGECRKSNDGHHVDDLICHECEHKLLAKYDDYAARIYLQCNGETAPCLCSGGFRLHQFKGPIDRRTLRAFWASLLWRLSIDYHEAYEDFNLHADWSERIRLDMISEGDFEYVDALPISLSGPAMGIYYSPISLIPELNPVISGLMLKVRLPNFFVVISLGYEMPPVLTRAYMKHLGNVFNCSLKSQYATAGYAFGECKELPEELDLIRGMHEVSMSRMGR